MVGVVAYQVNLENAVGSLGKERGRLAVTKEEGAGTACGVRLWAPRASLGVSVGQKHRPDCKACASGANLLMPAAWAQPFAFRHVKMQLPETQGSVSLLGFG